MRRFALARERTLPPGFSCLAVVLGFAIAAALSLAAWFAVVTSMALVAEGTKAGLGFVLAALIVGAGFAVRGIRRRRAPRPDAEEVRRGPSVALGVDGVAVHRARSTRFHPWSKVREVRRDSRVVTITLDDGKTDLLVVADARALESALLDAKRHHDELAPSPRLRVLELDGEADAAWVERARGAASQPGYRVEGASTDVLLSVLEDPKQPPAQRLGAALALSASPDEVRQRVRIAVEDTADPELSRALEEASAGELGPRSLERVARGRQN